MAGHPGGIMDLFQQRAQSVWQKVRKTSFASLNNDVVCDVCVIGAGISGLTAAYMLAKEGRKVVVIDRETQLASHESGLSSAHLSNALDDRYTHLRRLHGEQGARLAAESHTAAIDEIERIVNEENIRCDFERVPGYLILGPDDNPKILEEEFEAARAAGLTDVEMADHSPEAFFHACPCLKFPRQAQFHPVRYLIGLAKAVQRAGGRIFTQTAAIEVEGGRPARVHTLLGHRILCEDVIVATNVPFNDKITMHTKIAAYRSYVIGIEVPWGQIAPALYWDTADPYHYVRLVRDTVMMRDLIIAGGEDHRVGHEEAPEHRFQALIDWARERLGLDGPVMERWSGQIIEPIDGLAYIGRNPADSDNVYIATGDSGHGLTHGTLAGMILRDLILSRDNPWTELYDPGRINLRGLGTYLKEAVQSTAPFADWLTPGKVDSVAEIQPGEGAVLRDGLRKVAIYKDTFGNLHSLSATCSHLGCVVRWNGAEKTWDCPCHGSRYNRYGEVVNGPAPYGLKPARLPGELDDRAEPPPRALRLDEAPDLGPAHG
jgi:glycine/D-amino acid oxidase-like deaminating enzyme/nitrite reductase/ring-hydroxylating ferredoxin subunit